MNSETLARTAALLVTLTGCVEGGPIGSDDWPRRRAESDCSYFFNCCDSTERAETSPLAFVRPPPTTQDECVTQLSAVYLDSFMRNIAPSLASGRAIWNPNAAGECVAETHALGCVRPTERSLGGPACDRVPEGQTALDGACSSNVECASRCCALGICAPLPGLGEPCSCGRCQGGLACGGGGCVETGISGATCDGN